MTQKSAIIYTSSDKEKYISIIGERNDTLNGFKELIKEYTKKYNVGLRVFAAELANIMGNIESELVIDNLDNMFSQMLKDLLDNTPKEILDDLSDEEKEILEKKGFGEYIND